MPSPRLTITLPATGARSGDPSQGALSIASVSETAMVGGARIRFARATIPSVAGPQTVDLGVAFKARVLPAGETPIGCQAPGGTASAAGGGRGQGAGGRSGTPPAPEAPSARTSAPPAAASQAPPSFAEGDVLHTKIDNVKLLASASDTAAAATTVNAADALVYLGEEQNGYLHVQGSGGEGWVRRALVVKKP